MKAMMNPYMMHMHFYQSNELTLLIKGFDSNGSNGQYAGLLLIVFAFCVLIEGINYHRYVMLKAHGKSEVDMAFKMKIVGSYFVSIFLAYAIMLVIMSFNGGAFITVVLGLTVGNCIFSYFKKKNQIEQYNLAIKEQE